MEELTKEQFAATLLWEIKHPYQMPVRWLCASKEHKQERMDLFDVAFKRWRDEELEMKQERESRVNAIIRPNNGVNRT